MESNQNQTLRREPVLSYGLIVMRQTLKAGVGILILLLVGCGASKATWLPWVKNPKTAAPPTTVAKTKEQPGKHDPVTPPKTNPNTKPFN